MDLTMYYEKIREVRAKIKAEFVVAVSLETPDGGKAGIFTEVPRAIAAKMFVDGQARAATAAEERDFHEAQAKAKLAADQAAAAARMTFNVVAQSAVAEKE